MIDISDTINSGNFGTSPTILALGQVWGAALSIDSDIEKFLNIIFDLQTASGFGLDILGRIVGINRGIVTQSQNFFGFSRQAEARPFNQAPFYLRGTPSGQSIQYLPDSKFRQVILCKSIANISDTSIVTINKLLRLLSYDNQGTSQAPYVVNNSGNMAYQIRVPFNLSAVERSIILNTGAIPSPAGVAFSIIEG